MRDWARLSAIGLDKKNKPLWQTRYVTPIYTQEYSDDMQEYEEKN